MDDPHRAPAGRDRDPLAGRIRAAAEQGRISAPDRDIRLSNLASAQSMAELDLISRDLDQLEAALPAVPRPAVRTGPETGFAPVAEGLAEATVHAARSTARGTARSFGVVAAVVLAIALAGFSAARYVGHSSSGSAEVLFSPSPIPSGTADPADEASPSDDPSTPAAGAAYGLTGPGIRGFLADYRSRFGTTLTVDLTMYDGYAVADVPHGGPHRHAGFLYRPDQGWTDFGGVTTDFPGAEPVDLTRLDVRALVRNVARARRTLNVDNPTTTYVIVRQYAPGDVVPSVDIHVTNEFDESGYLATRLEGTVERAYPYAR